MEPVHVLAIITAKPGRRAELLQAFKTHAVAVRAEDGCIEYIATVDAEGAGSIQTRFGEDTLVVIETWASLDAFTAHAAAPHMKAYAERIRGLIATCEIRVLSSYPMEIKPLFRKTMPASELPAAWYEEGQFRSGDVVMVMVLRAHQEGVTLSATTDQPRRFDLWTLEKVVALLTEVRPYRETPLRALLAVLIFVCALLGFILFMSTK